VAKKQRKPPSRGLDKIVLRTPPGLRDRLRELASASGRSANAVIVDLLEKGLADSADQKNLLRDLVEDQDILRIEVAGLRRMVEKLMQDRLDRDDPSLIGLKGDPPGPER
jgi:predicted DNA-binding protein